MLDRYYKDMSNVEIIQKGTCFSGSWERKDCLWKVQLKRLNERAVYSGAHKVSGEARICRVPSQQPKEGSVSVVQFELGRS